MQLVVVASITELKDTMAGKFDQLEDILCIHCSLDKLLSPEKVLYIQKDNQIQF